MSENKSLKFLNLVTLDDTNTRLTYNGDWSSTPLGLTDSLGQMQSPAFERTLHKVSSGGATVTLSFEGSGVIFWGTIDSEEKVPSFKCTLSDGTALQRNTFGKHWHENRVALCWIKDLVEGSHSVTLYVEDASSDSPFYLDSVGYQPLQTAAPGSSAVEWVMPDDPHDRLQFENAGIPRLQYDRTSASTWALSTYVSTGSKVTLKFDGSNVALVGIIPMIKFMPGNPVIDFSRPFDEGVGEYIIDNNPPQTFQIPSVPENLSQTVFVTYFTLENLSQGQHTLVVKEQDRKKSPLTVSYFELRQDKNTGSSLSKGAIAGIVVGVVSSVALITLIGWILWNRRRQRQVKKQVDLTEPDNTQAPFLFPSPITSPLSYSVDSNTQRMNYSSAMSEPRTSQSESDMYTSSRRRPVTMSWHGSDISSGAAGLGVPQAMKAAKTPPSETRYVRHNDSGRRDLEAEEDEEGSHVNYVEVPPDYAER